MAIPARILYISTLEFTREYAEHIATSLILDPPQYFPFSQNQLQPLLPLVTPFSGGVAGGMAALSSQLIVVPMDVISQKQMVSENPISAREVMRTIISFDGYRGLFRGFGLSLLTSLPAGSIWWAIYAGSKDQLLKMNLDFGMKTEAALIPGFETAKLATIQVASAFSAAIAAALVTQPLDTIKTRLQVLGTTSGASAMSITKELASTGKLYQGLLPRIAHMGIWGSVLSSAYEYLKVVSRKDA
jgi:solute carrier family 25 protein 44